MRNPLRDSLLVGLAAVTLLCGSMMPAAGQTSYRAPRTPDGKPDLNGIWQALSTANWDLQDHVAQAGLFFQLGALGATPPGQGVVEGNEIPYQPWAAAKKKENFDKRLTLYQPFDGPGDPEAKCYMPGVPRATYMPYPFQIVQTPTYVLISYEFASANRLINMEPGKPSVDTWMGWSNGHWEGETLVVDVRGLNGKAWFDRAGNFASENLHVVERYTPMSPHHLLYEATIEDPTVFTRPWKISMPLYRRMEKNVQLGEFKCIEFAEEMLYGDLRKQTSR